MVASPMQSLWIPPYAHRYHRVHIRPRKVTGYHLMLFYTPDNSAWFMSLRHYFLYTCIYSYVLYSPEQKGGQCLLD